MHKQTLTIKTYVSDTPYCESCRFCKVTKGGQTCLLTNELLVRDNFGVLKSKQCLACKRGTVEDEYPHLSMAKVTTGQILKLQRKYFDHYMRQGYPVSVASDMAIRQVLEECD